MLVLAIVLLSAALAVVLVKWLLLRREVSAMARSVKSISAQNTNRQLRVATQDRQIAQLANAVNELYEDVDRICAEQMQAGDELRQNMADISHDLRTPLTSILGYLGLLAKPDNTPAQQKEYLAVATEKAEALRRMVDALFELARLEAGAYHFTLEKLDGADVLVQEIAACYGPFAETGQAPDIDLPDVPLYLLADRLALQRVFANLLQNILRHGGTNVRIAAAKSEGRAVFIFCNKAPNLVPKDIEHLFERSYTGDKTRGDKNTGLGLSITREFTRQMGGEIAAELKDGNLRITLAWPAVP